MFIKIFTEPFDPWSILADFRKNQIESGKTGACSTFIGTMRDYNEGDNILSMKLEYYPGMTEDHLANIIKQSIKNHNLQNAFIVHRVGQIKPGDDIVLVAAFSPHRKEAFNGCREIMESLKSTAPFWKKEVLENKERWVTKNTGG